MLKQGTQDSLIQSRTNLPNDLNTRQISVMIPPKIRAQSFFSARVAEGHILDKLREITDGYSRGDFGLGEARNKLKEFLWGEGYDRHLRTMQNLASTARLNLILKQNAAMAHAAAEWKRMHDPDAMKVYPYVRYHARTDRRCRPEHAQLDGRIFRKDDPFLSTHTPPWDFNCRCWLEEIDEQEAGETPDLIQPPTPADKVTVDTKSGFSFDPAHAFEKFDYSAIKDPDLQDKAKSGVEQILAEESPAQAPAVPAPSDPSDQSDNSRKPEPGRAPEAKTPIQESEPAEKSVPVKEPEPVKEPKPTNPEPGRAPEVKQPETGIKSPDQSSQTVNQPGAQDVRKNERFETVGINLQNPEPYPQDDKHRKLRPVYNAIRQASETDFTQVITSKGANMNREFIGVYDSSGKPFWIGMGPKNIGAANFPQIPKGCTFIHNHPNGSTFSVADIRAFIENEMTRMVVSIQSKDSTGKQVFHKYTLTKKDSGVKLPLEEIKQRYEKEFHNKTAFEAWKAALNGSCYEIEFS